MSRTEWMRHLLGLATKAALWGAFSRLASWLWVSHCKNSSHKYAKNFCRIVREKTWFFANEPGYAAAKPLRVL